MGLILCEEINMTNKLTGYKKLSINDLKKFEYNLEHIRNAAIFFKDHFLSKEMIYFTEKETTSVIFKRSNFMHLCGIHYESGATEFFNLALLKQIDLSKVFIKNDGTTFQKLSVLSSIDFLINPEITLSSGAIYLNLSFDKALRTKTKVFALTLINDEHLFIPQSLLNLRAMNNFPKGNKIIGIKSVHLEDKTEIIYS